MTSLTHLPTRPAARIPNIPTAPLVLLSSPATTRPYHFKPFTITLPPFTATPLDAHAVPDIHLDHKPSLHPNEPSMTTFPSPRALPPPKPHLIAHQPFYSCQLIPTPPQHSHRDPSPLTLLPSPPPAPPSILQAQPSKNQPTHPSDALPLPHHHSPSPTHHSSTLPNMHTLFASTHSPPSPPVIPQASYLAPHPTTVITT